MRGLDLAPLQPMADTGLSTRVYRVPLSPMVLHAARVAITRTYHYKNAVGNRRNCGLAVHLIRDTIQYDSTLHRTR